MKIRCAMVGVGLACAGALGQSTPVGPFVGDAQEGFEGQPGGFNCNFTLFGGAGGIAEISGGCSLLATSGWGFGCTIFPHSGGTFFGSAGGAVVIKIDPPICMFGGYFGTNVPAQFSTGDGKAAFYDANGNHIDSQPISSPPDCTWTWNGWKFATPVAAIEVYGGNVFGGGFQMMDDLEISKCSASCYPDCEEDGDLDVFDFLCYQGAFANQTPYADCEQDGDWDVFDFLCYQGAFAAGCN